MIKIKVSSQLDSVDNVSKLFNPDLYLRPVAIEMIPIMAERIHERGEDSNGEQIGTYSKKYMEVRKEFGRGSDTKVIASLTRHSKMTTLSMVLHPVGLLDSTMH